MAVCGLTSIRESLNSLCCVICGNYLSYKPVHGKICGHCVAQHKIRAVRNAAYEALASAILFPCINNKEGCSYQGSPADISLHEDTSCPYRIYKCPSGCDWSGTAVELVLHYKKDHSNCCVDETTTFTIDDLDKCVTIWLLEKEEFYFFLLAQMDGDHLALSAFYFTSKYETIADIPYNITLGDKTGTDVKFENQQALYIRAEVNKFCEKPQHRFSLDAIIRKDKLSFTINFDISHFESVETFDGNIIRCTFCNFICVPPIYSCHKGHAACTDCAGTDEYWCRTCDEEVAFNHNTKFENIAGLSQYTCRWANCNRIVSCRQIQRHERSCAFRIFSCVYCSCSGILDDLTKHIDISYGKLVKFIHKYKLSTD